MDRDRVLKLLGDRIEPIRAHGVVSISLFGSFARNQATTDSDVDLLVDFGSPATFDQTMDLKLYLEDLLGTRVDLVTRGGLRPRIRPRVEAEAIRVA
jgi:uncharacterized protein